MSWGIIPYLRRRLSQNYPWDSSVTLRWWDISLIYAPLLFALWRWLLSWPPVSFFCLYRSAISTCYCSLLAPVLSPCTKSLWPKQFRAVPPRIEPTSSLLSTLEVLYTHYAGDQGFCSNKRDGRTFVWKISRSSVWALWTNQYLVDFNLWSLVEIYCYVLCLDNRVWLDISLDISLDTSLGRTWSSAKTTVVDTVIM